ncbi:MAG: hypothetical protein VKL59_20560 [Nostocaceae cyanobacterium]|nr:hypothetical protein [Nostocaceae cyanobacterium]
MSKNKFSRRLSAFYAPRAQASPTAVNYLIFRNARKKSIGSHSHSLLMNSAGSHWHHININSAGSHSHTVSTNNSSAILGNPVRSGSGDVRHGNETRSKNLALIYCIKY